MSARARREIEQLYRGHRDAVYRSVLRDVRDPHEAEDVTQTAFLQAYRSVLRGRRPERPLAWLLTIADNLRRRRFVRAHAKPREVALVEEVAAADAPSASEIRDALEDLPTNQRAAFMLRELGGLSYDEIARHLDVSVGSVQMLLFRARRTLREESAELARRASSLLPPWLVHAFNWPERFAAPARAAAGLAIAVGLATSVPASDAGPGTHPSVAPAKRAVASTVAAGADAAEGPIVRPPRRQQAQTVTSARRNPPGTAPVTLPVGPTTEQVAEAAEPPAVGQPAPLPDVPRVSLPDASAELLTEPAPSLPLPPVPLPPLPPLPVDVPAPLP